jgi:hypothetical protein
MCWVNTQAVVAQVTDFTHQVIKFSHREVVGKQKSKSMNVKQPPNRGISLHSAVYHPVANPMALFGGSLPQTTLPILA